ncbi:MAG TPA: hypothetical protein VHE35_25420 [Kofleriaceae bacterium]|nr:hypothetical protein [Kofleriaceae bacterium]
MRLNGLTFLVARGVELAGDAALARWQAAIALGALREDVWYLPGLGRAVEAPSVSHFFRDGAGGFVPLVTPGARGQTRRIFARAVRLHRGGDEAAGYVQLGRCAHLLADMACPVHVHRYPHDSDGYEWWIESHTDELRALPVPAPPDVASAAALIDSLARFTRTFAGDATQWSVGRALRRRGVLRGLPMKAQAEAARAIVPVAAAHMAALFRHFRERVGARAASPVDGARVLRAPVDLRDRAAIDR